MFPNDQSNPEPTTLHMDVSVLSYTISAASSNPCSFGLVLLYLYQNNLNGVLLLLLVHKIYLKYPSSKNKIVIRN
jgi:hypothetical protein